MGRKWVWTHRINVQCINIVLMNNPVIKQNGYIAKRSLTGDGRLREEVAMRELTKVFCKGVGGRGWGNFPYILLNEIQTMFLQLAKQSSRQ